MRADICNRCSVKLTVDNWHKSAAKRRWLICTNCARLRLNEYNRANPDKVFKKNMERRYGITYDQYVDLLNKQNGVCAICEQTEPHSSKKNLSIDHCHKTGIVRGLLCSECNTGLGKFKDDIKLLNKAKEYLCIVN